MTDELAPPAMLPVPVPTMAAGKARLSQIFRRLAAESEHSVSIEELRDSMGDRGFAMLLVLFAALNLLPLPPGSTLILGIPLMLVSAQMMLGYPSAWLPRFLLAKSIGADRFRHAVTFVIPRLEWLERLVRPRHWPFETADADRYLGIATFVLAVAVFLPIPLGNWLPAFAIAVMGLALSERDGLFFVFGIATGIASLAVIGAVVGAAGAIASAVFGVHF
jgi:hypothetical protein